MPAVNPTNPPPFPSATQDPATPDTVALLKIELAFAECMLKNHKSKYGKTSMPRRTLLLIIVLSCIYICSCYNGLT